MAKNKIRIRKWDLKVLAQDLTLPQLLEEWKQTCIAETKKRAKSVKSLQEFKKWFFLMRKATILEDRVTAIYNEYYSIDNPSDAIKDFLFEKRRINNDLDAYFEKVPSIYWLYRDNKQKIIEYFKDKDLKPYKANEFARIFGEGEHSLSKQDEKYLWVNNVYPGLEKVQQSLSKILVREDVRDENGIEPNGNLTFKQVMSCTNPSLRKSAWSALNKPRYEQRPVLYSLITTAVWAREYERKLRKYDSYFAYFMNLYYGLDVSDFVFSLKEASKFAKINAKFYNYKEHLNKTAYGLENYNFWDHELKLKDTNDNISSHEAKQDLYKGLSCLGDEYHKHLKQILESKRINWSNECKGSGYCLSCQSFGDGGIINFGWDGSSTSIVTLGHELGHVIGTKIASENNDCVANPKYTLNEVDSIVNNVIMGLYYIDKIKKNNGPKEHLYGIYVDLIDYLLHNICLNVSCHIFVDNTIYEILNKDYSCDKLEEDYIYWKMQYQGYSKSWGKKVIGNYPQRYMTWRAYNMLLSYLLDPEAYAKILSYYFGTILGVYIGYEIYNGNKELLNKYLKFLKEGNLSNPVKVVKDTLGINLLKPEIYTATKQILSKLINQFEKDIKI